MKQHTRIFERSRWRFFPVFTALLFGLSYGDKVKVVASSSDLADLTRMAGGDLVEVRGYFSGDQDPHTVEPRPSMVAHLRGADLVLVIGMELDKWMDSLILAARNPKLMKGAPGYLDASANVRKKDVPTGRIDMASGDVHVEGNPHYLTDPENARLVLRAIAEKLAAVDPSHAAVYRKNLEAGDQTLAAAQLRFASVLKPFAGAPLVTWHPSWVYFTDRFALRVVGTIEPKPGIPPGPAHLKSLIETMKANGVKVILIEPYFDVAVAEKVARATGAKVLVFPQTLGGLPGQKTYLELVEGNVARLAQALR